MSLLDMIQQVKKILMSRQELITSEQWINQNRNYEIVTNRSPYFLKWQKDPFMAAGSIVFKMAGRVGVTANQTAITDFLHKSGFISNKIILFQWADSGIYCQNGDDFMMKAKPYTQKSGEREMVTLIMNLQRWD